MIIYWLLFMIRIYIQTQNKPINDSDLFIGQLAYINISFFLTFRNTVYNKTPDYSSNLLEPAFYSLQASFYRFRTEINDKNHDQAEMWNQTILLLAIFQTFHTIQTFAN